MTPFWLALMAAITTTLFGQTLLKKGASVGDFTAQLFHWTTILGLVLYGGAAILYIIALRRIPMSVALPCTAVSYFFAAAIGHYVFGEPFGLMHVGALLLIAAGVVMLAFAN